MSYDATAEPNEFFADTRAEAIEKAVRFFGSEEAELNIQELSDVFGLGARVAVVAVPKSAPKRPPGGDRDRERGREGERGGRGDRERGGRERGGRERGGREPAGREPGGREPGGRERERGERNESRGPQDQAAVVDVEEPSETPAPIVSKGQAEGDLSPIGEYMLGIIEAMGLGDFELSESEEDDLIVIQVKGPAIDQLSSDDRAVGALQLLANQAVRLGDEDPKRVVLDCDADAEQRESFLERQVGRAAGRAKDTGRSVALDPMNGRDRRALHVAVRDIEGVITMSIGTGRYRQVVIVPEGAPEYEEAAQAAQEAEQRDAERNS
ncbi:MAG: R3H domain-containing nucleic acid-binding protein [Myxococcota bacterium]